MLQPKVDHLAFVVKELERSVKFYQEVFGGEVGRARFLHFAFRIRPEEVDEVLQRLKRLDIPFDGPKVHGGSTSISIYFSDPDGYQLEFSTKFPDAETHRREMERLGASYGGAGTKSYEWQG